MNKLVNFGKEKKTKTKMLANSMAFKHVGIIAPHTNQLGTLIHQNRAKF
jgi:hypothetical protein